MKAGISRRTSRRIVGWSLSLSLTLSTATAQEVSYDLAEVDNGDGTFSLLLPAELTNPPDEVRGLVTWRYAGQAEFPYVTPQTVDDPGDVPVGPLDALADIWRTERIDRYGRRWSVVAINEGALEAKINTARATAAAVEGSSNLGNGVYSAEEPGQVTFHNWTTNDCLGTDYHVWDGDDRLTESDPLIARQKTMVSLTNGANHEPLCSAVMIHDHVALTAAHCIQGSPLAASLCIKGLWRYDDGGSGYCRGVDSYVDHPDYTTNQMNADLGVVFLDPTADWPSDIWWMALSQADDSRINALTNARNLAYPGWRDTEPTCLPGPEYDSDSEVWGSYMVSGGGEINQVTEKKVGARIDGGPGHSGSPIFYCPEAPPVGDGDDNVCSFGESAYVIGVWSGWYDGGTTKYHGGPKVPYYHDWLVGWLP